MNDRTTAARPIRAAAADRTMLRHWARVPKARRGRPRDARAPRGPSPPLGLVRADSSCQPDRGEKLRKPRRGTSSPVGSPACRGAVTPTRRPRVWRQFSPTGNVIRLAFPLLLPISIGAYGRSLARPRVILHSSARTALRALPPFNDNG